MRQDDTPIQLFSRALTFVITSSSDDMWLVTGSRVFDLSRQTIVRILRPTLSPSHSSSYVTPRTRSSVASISLGKFESADYGVKPSHKSF